MIDYTPRELSALSDDPERFSRCHETALEVIDFAARHGGRLPWWVWRLGDRSWDELSATLRELDALEWVRRIVA